MRWVISRTMSSKVRSSSRLAVTSRYRVSMMASRSPSSVTAAPVVVLIVFILLPPEALDRRRRVGVNLQEVLRARHRQHRLDALLHAGQLEDAAGGGRLAIEIHEAPD